MMKMNKWTMALAAAGVVSLSSVAQAQEAAAGADALAASTTLTGYVSTSYTLDGVDAGTPGGYWRSGEDNNQFSLDVVSLTLASAQGAGEYALVCLRQSRRGLCVCFLTLLRAAPRFVSLRLSPVSLLFYLCCQRTTWGIILLRRTHY